MKARSQSKAVNLKLKYEEETGGVDMCKAMEKNNLKREVTGAIMGMRKLGASDDKIITTVMEMFNVTKEYVLAIMNAQVA